MLHVGRLKQLRSLTKTSIYSLVHKTSNGLLMGQSCPFVHMYPTVCLKCKLHHGFHIHFLLDIFSKPLQEFNFDLTMGEIKSNFIGCLKKQSC
jgi:hypothetical protein